MIDYAAIGKAIRIQRKSQHITQMQLAEMASLSASFLGHIERGSRVMSLESLVSICNALKVEPSSLLGSCLDAQKMDLSGEIGSDVQGTLLRMLTLAK